MKKLLTLLFIAPFLFSACGDDEEETYFNPVEGSWVYTWTDGDTDTRVFSKNFEAFVFITNNSNIIKDSLGIYTINKTQIFYNDGTSHNYKITKDSLFLESPRSDWNRVFVKKFK